MVPKKGEKISGDSTVMCENTKGEFVAAISDAMGSGASAAKDSADALEILKNFMTAGMEPVTSVELINSALLLRSSADKFVTMDMCVVNTREGSLKLIKSGAAPGYIKTSRGVSVVKGSMVPYGVLENHDKITTDVIGIGDSVMVVMVSDGLSEILHSEKGDALKAIVASTDTKNPQIMASVLMKQGLKACSDAPEDDMTVVVVAIQKA